MLYINSPKGHNKGKTMSNFDTLIEYDREIIETALNIIRDDELDAYEKYDAMLDLGLDPETMVNLGLRIT